MAIDVGDVVPLAVVITDDFGVAANAGAVVLTITPPDLIVATPDVVNGAVGAYQASYLTTQAGLHAFRWDATGVNACTFSDVFTVLPAEPGFLISVMDARSALGMPNGDKDEDIRTYMAAVTPVVEAVTGPILRATKVTTADGGSGSLLMPSAITAVISVTENGKTLAAGTDYVVNAPAGIITRGRTPGAQTFADGTQNVVVTYSAGGPTVPPNVVLAARIILRQLWQADQQGYRPAMGSPDMTTTPGPKGFAIPKRALELLTPGPVDVPGFA